MDIARNCGSTADRHCYNPHTSAKGRADEAAALSHASWSLTPAAAAAADVSAAAAAAAATAAAASRATRPSVVQTPASTPLHAAVYRF